MPVPLNRCAILAHEQLFHALYYNILVAHLIINKFVMTVTVFNLAVIDLHCPVTEGHVEDSTPLK